MYKYLRESEKRMIKKGLDEILAVKLIDNYRGYDNFYNGDIGYNKAIKFYKRVELLEKVVSKYNVDSIPEDVMVRYFEKEGICNSEQFYNFGNEYKPLYTNSSLIIKTLDIVNDKNYDAFYEGNLTFEDAIIFYLKLKSINSAKDVFVDKDYIMAKYCKSEFKDITVIRDVEIRNIVSSYKKIDNEIGKIIRCTILANTFKCDNIEMLNLAYLLNDITLTYNDLSNLFDLVNTNRLADYYEHKLSIDDAEVIYKEIRDNGLLDLLCPNNNKVFMSYLRNIIGIDYEDVVKCCYDTEYYCSSDERLSNKDNFLENEGDFDKYKKIRNCISIMSERLLSKDTVSNSYSELIMSDQKSIDDFDVFKDIYFTLDEAVGKFDDYDEEESFYGNFADEIGEETAIIVIKDFVMENDLIFKVNNILPYGEYSNNEAYSFNNNTYFLLGESSILFGLPVEVIIEIAISLVNSKNNCD